MNRTQKADSIESLKAKFAKANAAFVTEYRGMTVQSLYELRKKVREGNGELKVAKNRLVRIAIKGTPFESLSADLKGPLAVALSFKDPVPVAKALIDSRSDTSPFKIKLGNLNGKKVVEKEIEALSKLPSREVLLAQLLGTLKAPMQNFASVMAAVPRDFVGVLGAIKAKKEKQ